MFWKIFSKIFSILLFVDEIIEFSIGIINLLKLGITNFHNILSIKLFLGYLLSINLFRAVLASTTDFASNIYKYLLLNELIFLYLHL